MNTKTTASLIHRIASFETQYLNQELRSLDLILIRPEPLTLLPVIPTVCSVISHTFLTGRKPASLTY